MTEDLFLSPCRNNKQFFAASFSYSINWKPDAFLTFSATSGGTKNNKKTAHVSKFVTKFKKKLFIIYFTV
jgi:hypothetical protein